jgi:sugar phosphate isomerase/epimerase
MTPPSQEGSPHSSVLTRENWPIAAAMIQYVNVLPDGSSVQDQSPEAWAATLSDVTDAGFTELDPTDCWLRVADLSQARRDEFKQALAASGLTVPAISTSRRSIIDPEHGDAYLTYCHRVIDAAADLGAQSACFGLFGPLTDAQKKALWFWTVDGVHNPDDPAVYRKAVEGMRALGRHAEEVGIDIALEMYEDTYIGTADSAVTFVKDVDHPAVGLNPDLGNLIRLHRPMEHWLSMVEKTVPYVRYWHVKNYLRIEDEAKGIILSAPAPLETGLINYRVAIGKAIAHGFRGAFCCEHYGGDGLSVSGTNRAYLRRILPKQVSGR